MKINGRSILAYFTRREHAEQARSALRKEGFDTVQVDRIGRYGGESAQILHNPLTGNIDSLADLSAGADTDGGDAALFLRRTRAHPASRTVSPRRRRPPGMEPPPGSSPSSPVKTVSTAVQILEDTGGMV